MGSMESLSSHSSEQNSSSKTAFPAQMKDNLLLHRTPSQLSNGPKSAVWISGSESSSREDARRTDGGSEDALTLLSVTTTPRPSPAPPKAPHCHLDHRSGLLNCTPAPSLKSLHVSEGRRSTNKRNFELCFHEVIASVSLAVVDRIVLSCIEMSHSSWIYYLIYS